MKILALDSSGLVASVAVVEDDNLLGEYTINYKKTHSQTLLPMLDEVAKMIELLPAADVAEVKHGKWIQEQIKIENMSIVRYRNTCSECGGKADFLLRELHYSYCPHCGAKMDLED